MSCFAKEYSNNPNCRYCKVKRSCLREQGERQSKPCANCLQRDYNKFYGKCTRKVKCLD